ncbi:Thiol-disulfide isomerase or thioredoxin [Polaromonas sp. OV174]|uniref:TlpA family protein disulfide reductase n=1 Tax=Polaromonas sp. OV174 TaxID=1855300 RepID=UPI0008F3D3B7|nr:TlpA disulfide reductase family protein [Polaromonas sp. OV174]SFC28600.1 Thiol-disulfide isomerase or thioredoxin [Polaromonas sp. OV174]
MSINRRNVIQSVAALAAPGLGLSAWAKGAEAPLPKLGSALPLPALTLLDGRRWTPAEAEGKVLVVYWWASWCPFCAVQSPHIEALWRAQQAQGLQVLALSIDRQATAAVNYMKAKGYSFPAGLLTPEAAKVLPKPVGLPVVVVRGRDGKVVFAESGEMFPEDVQDLKKFL